MSMVGWYSEGGSFQNIAIAANQDGHLEIFTYEIGGPGRIFHKWQVAPNIGWSEWANFDTNEDRTYFNEFLYGHTDILAAMNGYANSCLQLFTMAGWTIGQTALNNGWGGWQRPHSISDQVSVTAVARTVDGKLYLFGVDISTLDVGLAEMNAGGGGWSDWQNFSHPTTSDASFAVRADDWVFRSGFARVQAPSQGVGCNQDGRIEIFMASSSQVFHSWQNDAKDPPAIWEDWAPLGAPKESIDNLRDLVAIQDGIGRLTVIAAGVSPTSANPQLWSVQQAVKNGGWASGWKQLPTLTLGFPPPLGSTDVPIRLKGGFRVARSADGRIVVFAVGADGALHYLYEDAAHAGWERNWKSLGGDGITAVDVGQNADGRLEVFIVSKDSVWHRWQMDVERPDLWSDIERPK